MKICAECQFSEKRGMEGMGPQGPMYQTILVCKHEECRDPVDGQYTIPCVHARKDPAFCGFNAKYYKQKEEESAKEPASVIQLVKE